MPSRKPRAPINGTQPIGSRGAPDWRFVAAMARHGLRYLYAPTPDPEPDPAVLRKYLTHGYCQSVPRRRWRTVLTDA